MDLKLTVPPLPAPLRNPPLKSREIGVVRPAEAKTPGPEGKSRPSSTFRSDIEGLRGLAILFVVAFHCGIPGVWGGFVGVDIFFVLSGYLITGLLVAEFQKTSSLNLIRFYARRARRLLPASAFMLLIILIASVFLMAPNDLAFAGRAARASALYMSNIFFAINSSDYFAPAVKLNPMLHTWSLAVEEQFYLFWPLIILLGMKSYRSKKGLLMFLSALSLVSLGMSVWFTAHKGTAAFYELPSRAWEFGVGGIAALYSRNALKLPARFWNALGWTGFMAIAGSVHFFLGNSGFPGWIALIPALGTVAILIACAENAHRGVGRLLDFKLLQTTGTLSYSWYLWHWPFLVFGVLLFPELSAVGKVGAAALAFVFAAVSHSLIENPIRFLPTLVSNSRLSLSLGALLTLSSAGASYATIKYAGHVGRLPAMQKIESAATDIANMDRDKCVTQGDSPEVKTCTYGEPASQTRVVLFGDSHAIQWFNPLLHIAQNRGWQLTTIVKSGCLAADVEIPGTPKNFAKNCAKWRADSIQRMAALQPSLVVVGNASNFLGRQDETTSKIGVTATEWGEGTKKTLSALTAGGLHVALLRDTPAFTIDIPNCLASSVLHTWARRNSCERAKATALDSSIFQAETNAASGMRNVAVIDLTAQLCEGNKCFTQQNGMVMYRDDNHLTGTFAASLTPKLDVLIADIIKKRV